MSKVSHTNSSSPTGRIQLNHESRRYIDPTSPPQTGPPRPSRPTRHPLPARTTSRSTSSILGSPPPPLPLPPPPHLADNASEQAVSHPTAPGPGTPASRAERVARDFRCAGRVDEGRARIPRNLGRQPCCAGRGGGGRARIPLDRSSGVSEPGGSRSLVGRRGWKAVAGRRGGSKVGAGKRTATRRAW